LFVCHTIKMNARGDFRKRRLSRSRRHGSRLIIVPWLTPAAIAAQQATRFGTILAVVSQGSERPG